MLISTLATIAQSGDSGGSSFSTVTVYYIVGSIATVLGVTGGLIRYYSRQKERWTLEGQQRAEQASAVKNNSDKLDENTHAIFGLTNELRDFISSVRSELNGHESRINILERFREEMRKSRQGGGGP
jgi:hypothetical protein